MQLGVGRSGSETHSQILREQKTKIGDLSWIFPLGTRGMLQKKREEELLETEGSRTLEDHGLKNYLSKAHRLHGSVLGHLGMCYSC